MIEQLKNTTYNITEYVAPAKKTHSVNETLKEHNVTDIEMPYARDFNNMQQDDKGNKFAPYIMDGKKHVIKEITNGFCGSVCVHVGSVLLEISLMRSDDINPMSQQKSHFKLVQPWDITTDENGKATDWKSLRPFSNKFKTAAENFTGIGNTYSKKDKSGNMGRMYASTYIPASLLQALKTYVDTLCLETTYLPKTDEAENNDANAGSTADDGNSQAQA